MTDRNTLYATAGATVSQALSHLAEAVQVSLNAVSEAHAADVETAGLAIDHLNSVVDLVTRLGWTPTWAKDRLVLDEARAFLATVTPEGDSNADQDPIPGTASDAAGPAGGPARA